MENSVRKIKIVKSVTLAKKIKTVKPVTPTKKIVCVPIESFLLVSLFLLSLFVIAFQLSLI